RLAGAGRAGDQAVAVGQRRQQRDRDVVGGALAEQDRVHGGLVACGCQRILAACGRVAALQGRGYPAGRFKSLLPMSFRFLIWRPLLAVLLLSCIVPTALAQRVSARDRAAADALVERMGQAETRFAAAVVLAGNGDPRGMPEGNAALEDMEDVIDACVSQRGCPLSDLLATYKRLLKAGIDARGEGLDEAGEDDHLLEVDPALAADVPEAVRAARLLGDDSRHAFDRMVAYNPAVQAGIRRWLTDMRPQLMTSYENYRTMHHLMWPEFEKRGLPEALLFGILAKESNGRVHSVSRAGAAGPMQFMPATGRRFGLGPDGTGFDMRYDPRSAAEASASYLNERLRELNNDVELSLAGYNGGEGRADRKSTRLNSSHVKIS